MRSAESNRLRLIPQNYKDLGSTRNSAPTLSRGSAAALGTWTTCNADLAGGHHQELAALEIVSVFRKHGIELFDLSFQFSSGETKENDAGVH
jgi:hypothetical protein